MSTVLKIFKSPVTKLKRCLWTTRCTSTIAEHRIRIDSYVIYRDISFYMTHFHAYVFHVTFVTCHRSRKKKLDSGSIRFIVRHCRLLQNVDTTHLIPVAATGYYIV